MRSLVELGSAVLWETGCAPWLDSLERAQTEPCTYYGELDPTEDDWVLAFGTCKKGSLVQQVQRRLVELGYTIDVDGFFGPQSARAIAHFQQAQRFDPSPRSSTHRRSPPWWVEEAAAPARGVEVRFDNLSCTVSPAVFESAGWHVELGYDGCMIADVPCIGEVLDSAVHGGELVADRTCREDESICCTAAFGLFPFL